MKIKEIGILLCLFFKLTFAQVSFTSFPQKLQLCGRLTPADTGIVAITGTVQSSTNYTGMRVKIYRNNTLANTLNQSLTFNGSNAAFSIKCGIKAELASYKFEALGVTGTNETSLRSADSIVCGDVYIIQGQSNAEAHSFSGSSNSYKSPYIRVCGYATGSSDTIWRIGQGDGAQNTVGNTGQWGIVFAKMIVDTFKIPVAIFNGCASGTAISNFARNDAAPDNTNKNYGVLLTRLKKSGLASYVKAVFWFQGEQNANDGTSTVAYKTAFTTLFVKGWLVDYPSIKKAYIFQIGTGCNTSGKSASLYTENVNQIKEAHRELGHSFGDSAVTVASSESNRYVDGGNTSGCHFPFANGYEPLGKNAYQLLARDFYGKPSDNIASPTIKFAEVSGAQEMTLVMENILDSLKWASGSESYFRLEGSSVKVSGGSTYWNKIKLPLTGNPTGANAISYLGHDNTADPIVSTLYGIGSIHFYKFPLTTAKYRDSISVVEILKRNFLTVPVDSVATYSGQRITGLKLNAKKITTMPPDIGYMDSLKSIDLGSNTLNTLPQEITRLSPATLLNVNSNRLCGQSDLLVAWINKYSKDATWKNTQMMDATNSCGGTFSISNVRPGIVSSTIVDKSIVNSQVFLKFHNPTLVQHVYLYTANGKLVRQYHEIPNLLQVDMRKLGKGLFILQIKTMNELICDKIMLL